MNSKIKVIFEKLLDFVYPSNLYCICCGAVVEKDPYSMCEACKKSVVWANKKTCSVCGKSLQDWEMTGSCIDCKGTHHFFTKGYTCMQYSDVTKKIIHDLKYGAKGYVSRNIGRIMADRIKAEGMEDYTIVPVPMYKKKQKQRGYNQAELIAQQLCKLTDMAYDHQTLIRSRQTEVMSRLSADERQRNLIDAFSVVNPKNIQGRKVLLVDDVYTTGSTADGCSKSLLEAGALQVNILTFAAGQNTFKNQAQVD